MESMHQERRILVNSNVGIISKELTTRVGFVNGKFLQSNGMSYGKNLLLL